jgi:hypothetical protein
VYALTVVRLQIGISPYSFHDQNHKLLSVLLVLAILGINAGHLVVSILIRGGSCDVETALVVKGLYGEDLFPPDSRVGGNIYKLPWL